jgi:hypothetical protein
MMATLTLQDRTGDVWVQPDSTVDSWDSVGQQPRQEWQRRQVELAWGPVIEVIEVIEPKGGK